MNPKDWMSGSATREEDTSELTTEEMFRAFSDDPNAHTRAALDEDAFDPDTSGGGTILDTALEYGRAYWHFALAGVAVVILVVVVAGRLLGGSGEAPPVADTPPNQDAQNAGQAAPGDFAEPAGPVKDTGVAFEKPVVKDGKYYLQSGEISWKGKVEDTETGQELTLEGPTAAQFKRAVALPNGEIMTGVFGRAQPDQPIVHGTFQRVSLGDSETTSGTYKAVDGGQILADGYYTDEHEGNTVIRTYREVQPQADQQRAYRVSFEAPVGTPVPTLIGWEPPTLPDGTDGQ